ncbi:MAG: metallophosphatase domain-containing protein [Planctomycetes bacterium]|nr:metallophosphatase domain-containing protein [Planctomycetota bacterium]MCW8135571.1 metallophosphatase domain-containing protein [Planctomycetota bacterium]
MRLVCISDTHGRHGDLDLPDGDVLVHSGDFCAHDDVDEVRDFSEWLYAQPFEHRVVIAGNHDLLFENAPELAEGILRKACPGVHYLFDSGVEIDGIKFWGSPWQPRFFDWAFNLERGQALRRVWAKVPAGIDVLITHGPPQGVLDETHDGRLVGCEELKAALGRIKPRVHIFGHIHEGYGETKEGGVHFVNAASLDAGYRKLNPPIVVQL